VAVLVVDDDPLVLEVTTDMLKDLGCEFVTAAMARTRFTFRKKRTSRFWLPTST
jgi:CheY-like chemotaxis protein